MRELFGGKRIRHPTTSAPKNSSPKAAQNSDIYGWSFTWIKNSVAVVIELNCPGHLSGPGKSEVEDNHHLRWKFENVIRATQGD